jgi:hypothetical protein
MPAPRVRPTLALQASRRAVMMPEVVEVDGLPALKLQMFKQDTLTGVRTCLCLCACVILFVDCCLCVYMCVHLCE